MSGIDKFFDRSVGRARRTWFFVCVESALEDCQAAWRSALFKRILHNWVTKGSSAEKVLESIIEALGLRSSVRWADQASR